MQWASVADAQTPTTTASGQSQWVSNVLCGYLSAGLSKLAYWSMYDPYTLWATSPWSQSGGTLAWDGFWGLAYENDGSGSFLAKPSWATLSSYYLNGSLSCTASPVVSLQADASYYTLAQPMQMSWTAAETHSLSLSQGDGSHSYSCITGRMIPYSGSPQGSLVGSCAHTNASPFNSTGNKTVTLTATNGYLGFRRRQ